MSLRSSKKGALLLSYCNFFSALLPPNALCGINRYGSPAIFNTDQGSQFTSKGFNALLREKGIAISMDGKGCWRDNVFVERLWKSIKYEEVYLHAYNGVNEAKSGLERYLTFYNQHRPHSKLDRLTPDEVYFGCRENLPDAAGWE